MLEDFGKAMLFFIIVFAVIAFGLGLLVGWYFL